MLEFLPRALWRSLPLRGSIPIVEGQTFEIDDTLNPLAFVGGDESEVFQQISWVPQRFSAQCKQSRSSGDVVVEYPSPLPQGNELSDTVSLDWHIARDAVGQFTAGPAVLVLDILQGGNLVSGFIAKTLAKNGIHGFVLHMPQNGRRKASAGRYDWSHFLPSILQAAADGRRARDVIAALPLVTGPISLQGTSLGGFVATLTGAIDGAFDNVILALTGGDVYRILAEGAMDAARVRRHLRDVGYDDQSLAEFLWKVEPLRVAHRLNPQRTWLFSARFDQVIPQAQSKKLAAAIGLDFQHHRQLAGCHYTCALGAPRFLSELVRTVSRRSLHAQIA